LTNIYRTCTIYLQLALCLLPTTVCRRPLGSWGPGLKPI